MPFYEFSCKRGTKPYPEKSSNSTGISGRTIYQHDKGAITYCKAFRRLAFKSHLVGKRDDHCRTKLLHSLEVANIATQMALLLGLDLALTEVIALGHDIGSYPFTRVGEDAIKEKLISEYKIISEHAWDQDLSHHALGFTNLLSDEDQLFSAKVNSARYKMLMGTGCYYEKKNL